MKRASIGFAKFLESRPLPPLINKLEYIMKNLIVIAFLSLGCVSFFLSGCVSSSFRSNIKPNAIKIGMSESEFVKEFGHLGEKMYYSSTDSNSFLWILNTGSERVWLSGNAFLGGVATTRHHTMVISFDDNKVSKMKSSYMDASSGNRLQAEGYRTFYFLEESLDTCKSYLPYQDRGRYGYILTELVNSWIHSPDVYEFIDQYNRSNANILSPQGETQCNDAFAFFEKAANQLDQINKRKN
jgi:hypothetical protein